MKRNKPTFMQYVILDIIRRYIDINNESPTLQELCDLTGINTRSTIHKHVHNLEKLGYLDITPKTKRGIRLKDGKNE